MEVGRGFTCAGIRSGSRGAAPSASTWLSSQAPQSPSPATTFSPPQPLSPFPIGRNRVASASSLLYASTDRSQRSRWEFGGGAAKATKPNAICAVVVGSLLVSRGYGGAAYRVAGSGADPSAVVRSAAGLAQTGCARLGAGDTSP